MLPTPTQLIDVNGYIHAQVLYTDVTTKHEVILRLTPQSKKDLIEYHKKYHQGVEDETYDKLHNQFVRETNKFFYRTRITALDMSEDSGMGELFYGECEAVKNQIMKLIDSHSLAVMS